MRQLPSMIDLAMATMSLSGIDTEMDTDSESELEAPPCSMRWHWLRPKSASPHLFVPKRKVLQRTAPIFIPGKEIVHDQSAYLRESIQDSPKHPWSQWEHLDRYKNPSESSHDSSSSYQNMAFFPESEFAHQSIATKQYAEEVADSRSNLKESDSFETFTDIFQLDL